MTQIKDVTGDHSAGKIEINNLLWNDVNRGVPHQSSFFISSERLPDGERNTEQILNLNLLQLTHRVQGLLDTPAFSVSGDSPSFPHPAGLTPVGDYMEACAEAVPDAVLVLFLADLAVAHPDPVALLEELPGGFLAPSRVRNRLSVCASVRPPVH